MQVVIMGRGRTGSALASWLEAEGDGQQRQVRLDVDGRDAGSGTATRAAPPPWPATWTPPSSNSPPSTAAPPGAEVDVADALLHVCSSAGVVPLALRVAWTMPVGRAMLRLASEISAGVRAGGAAPLRSRLTSGPPIRDLSLQPILCLPGILTVSARRERELDRTNCPGKPG